MKKNRTLFTRTAEVRRDWLLVDAGGAVLGRLATRVAGYLRGKHKPCYTPNADCGDFVVVINAAKVRVTGSKETGKTYFTHSGYPDGDKLLTLRQMRERQPEKIIFHAVAGMLPKTKLGKQMIRKLRVYPGAEHPHRAAKIQELKG